MVRRRVRMHLRRIDVRAGRNRHPTARKPGDHREAERRGRQLRNPADTTAGNSAGTADLGIRVIGIRPSNTTASLDVPPRRTVNRRRRGLPGARVTLGQITNPLRRPQPLALHGKTAARAMLRIIIGADA
jgi:hypothetical protein